MTRDVRSPIRARVALASVWLATALALAPAAPAAAQDGGASGSTASNLDAGTDLSVNARTGGVSLDVALFRLSGVQEEISATLALSYRSEDAITDVDAGETTFGLPPGWSLDLTHLTNRGTYLELSLDGSETYVVDPTFTTQLTPVGGAATVAVKTGLQHVNQAKLQFRDDAGSVTVHGIASAYVLRTVDGGVRYLSANGLLIQEADRWGNQLEYRYAADVPATDARLVAIEDSWGQTITLDSCASSDDGCVPGTTTVALPDGRTVSWVVGATGVEQIVDPQGKVTVLAWGSACDGSYPVLTDVTSPAGGRTQVGYQCMDVCAQRTAPSSCVGQTRSWPVAATRTECPNAASCPGTASDGALTMAYEIGGTPSQPGTPNYTGYPYYSPYEPADPGADALMESNDPTFTYTTAERALRADQTAIQRTERQYDFLHLEREEQSYLPASDGAAPTVPARAKSSCYQLTADAPAAGCPLPAAVDYRQLPANYDQAVTEGTCVFAATDADTAGARVSVVTQQFDGFGNVLQMRRYHGTGATAVMPASACDRGARLDPSSLQLVFDSYLAYDTPATVDDDGWLMLGSGQYGLMTGGQAVLYPDAADTTAAADAATPVRVTLTCRTPGEHGRAIATEAVGLLGVDASPPAQIGVVTACTAPAWDTTVAPPKVHTFTYDGQGRVLTKVLSWGADATPGGVTQQTTTVGYTRTTSAPGTQACGQVLTKTETDDNGHTTTRWVCLENGFPLAVRDALGHTTTYEYDAAGLATKETLANGTYETKAYYYACPVANGTATCAGTAATACPYDAAGRSCLVERSSAGTDPTTGIANQSYADGVTQVTVKDGLGRPVAEFDDLGAASSGYTALQTTAATVYDDRGLVTSETSQIGTTDPLVYTQTFTYEPKLRAQRVCDARGVAHEAVRDDVGQENTTLVNGHVQTATTYNDRRQPTLVEECPLGTQAPGSASGACPTVAADPNAGGCAASGYLTSTQWDGSGAEMSSTSSDGGTSDTGGSVTAVVAQPTYAADLQQYGHTVAGTTVDGSGDMTAETQWTRDLNGRALTRVMTAADASGATDVALSDTYTYDGVGNTETAANPLGALLTERTTYTATNQVATRVDAAGVTFFYFYDALDHLVGFCHAEAGGDFTGERYTRDPLTGQILEVRHVTNPTGCSACTDGDCGDVAVSAIRYTYTRFGAVASKTYVRWDEGLAVDTAVLEWAYDAYQRNTCFADALATANGQHCPASPTAADWAPAVDAQRLTQITYWPDDDAYRRGLLESVCRGVDDAGGVTLRCVEHDYYTSADTGGACASVTGSPVTGAFAGLAKTQAVCSGGGCAVTGGSGTLVYRTDTTYDAYRRPCTVSTTNASGQSILAASYRYDQYGNVTEETHSSGLDASTASNYSEAYTYDGLLRLVGSERRDAQGGLLTTRAWAYDARGNVTTTSETQAGGNAEVVEVSATRWPPRRRGPTRRPWGAVRVKLWGRPGVDLRQLDPTTARLGGARPRSRGRRLRDRNRDGHADLTLKFRAQDMQPGAAPCLRAMLADGRALWGCADGAESDTVVTTSTYNADGALTQQRVEGGSAEPVVTSFVWDNFVPDADDPSEGTVRAGNGNLLGRGPSPSVLDTELTFDRRNRLVGVDGSSGSVAYTYDAASLLATASAGGETFAFVWDESAEPQMTNIVAEESGLTSCQLGPLRALSDGTQEMLLSPQKDVAGLYDAASERFAPYSYDAYGATDDAGTASELDLRDNPFRYAGEYRDQVWGGYYLRARWYDPALPHFISRDALPNLNRYGYADGDPRNSIDPSGHRSRRVHDWASYNRWGAQVFEKIMGTGLRGTLERTGFGVVLQPMSLVLNPNGFWHLLKNGANVRQNFVGDIALGLGIVGEVVLHRYDFFGYKGAFGTRIGFDALFGVGLSAASSVHHGFRQWNAQSFYQGLEYTANDILVARAGAAIGYRPFPMSADEALDMGKRLRTSLKDDDALVFRVRYRSRGFLWGRAPDSPFLDALDRARAHDYLVFMRPSASIISEVRRDFGVGVFATADDESLFMKHSVVRFEGVMSTGRGHSLLANPLLLPPTQIKRDAESVNLIKEHEAGRPGHWFWRNCQMHATAALAEIRRRQ